MTKLLSRRMFNKSVLAATLTAATGLARQATSQSALTLEVMEQKVDADYDLSHISVKELEDLKASVGDDVVLFDVREVDEYDVSHLADAKQLKPNMSRRSFRKRHANYLSGKHVVFYCSVGVRSSRMAQKMESVLKKAGVASVHNLRGGVFRIHNDQMPLLHSKAGHLTEDVHPYDSYWGQLLTRGEKFHRYKADK